MEGDIKKILSHLQNQDLLLKTLANKLSDMKKTSILPPAPIQPQPAPTPDPQAPKPTIPGLKPGVQIIKSEDGKTQLAKSMTGNAKGEKPVPVQQTVLYQNGAPISMARVEIYSGETLIKNIKTNNLGKWTNALAPGEYLIHITKKAGNTNPRNIDYTGKITITASKEPIQLEGLQL